MAHLPAQTDELPVLEDHDDPEPGMTWFITLASAIVLTALVLGLSALYYGVADQWTQEMVISKPAEQYERLRNDQLSLLAAPRRFEVLDADGNPVSRIGIPIGQAMEALVDDGALAPTVEASTEELSERVVGMEAGTP